MRAIVDSSVFIHFWRDGGTDLDGVTEAVVPLAVHAELLVGIEASADPASELRRVEGTFRAVSTEIIAPDLQTAEHWAKLRDQLRRRGRNLPHNDLWVAAAALQFGLPLFSLDRHHRDLPGVPVLPRRG